MVPVEVTNKTWQPCDPSWFQTLFAPPSRALPFRLTSIGVPNIRPA